MSKLVLSQIDIVDAVINSYSTYHEELFKRFDFDNLEAVYDPVTGLTVEVESKS